MAQIEQPTDRLMAWGRRVLAAQTLDEVFAEEPR